ncbi:MAG: aspartate-semialdehyde dehydrogenase [Desulfovibrio sp.]|nr:aspartate-semialdehyde dehydrogenase [Desulfovibrio sp.]MBQ1845791.1 aspartate-semialdehyde dehydrogenase [Desulfovibrio sp.]MBQ2476831.1 aspartate-semialdehyde dehydrogenase [Desulfovibrio sp.]
MKDRLTVAVCGAESACGQEMLTLLGDRGFPCQGVLAFASPGEAGGRVPFAGGELELQELKDESFFGVDLALFAMDAEAAGRFAPLAQASACTVVDASSRWRRDPRCPLVVPEANPGALDAHQGIVALPGACATAIALALKPLADLAGLAGVQATCLLAVSERGEAGVAELDRQVRALFNAREPKLEAFPRRIAFNVLPQAGEFLEDESTDEETGLGEDLRRLFSLPDLPVQATFAYVPVFYGHSVDLRFQTAEPLSPRACRAVLSQMPGLQVYDNPRDGAWPHVEMCAGEDEVFAGRIRSQQGVENGLAMWLAVDNLRKGCALNAVQVAELLFQKGLVRVEDRSAFRG